MKKLIISALFISMVSFTFANGIKKDDTNKNNTSKTEQIVQQENKVLLKKDDVKPDAVFTCAKEVVVNGETILIVTSAWGITGARAMNNCNSKLESILVY